MIKTVVKFMYDLDIFNFIDIDKISLFGQIKESKLVKLDLVVGEQITGNIYKGRVSNVLDNMNCAFVNIGRSKHAYLPKKYICSQKKNSTIKQGDIIYVEVKKEETGNKGAVVTMDYSVRGRYMVLLPMSHVIKISRKIYDKETKSRLYNWAKNKKYFGGIILRTSSEKVSNNILDREFKMLLKIVFHLEAQRNHLPVPTLIYSKSSLKNFFLDEYKKYPTIVNRKAMANMLEPLNVGEIIYNPDFSILKTPILRKQYKELFQREISLTSGGNIIFDSTEALTVIDVNTGTFTKGMDFGDIIYKTNLEAAEKIIQQIKLRNIGGMIIIDFIHMENNLEKENIFKLFKENFKEEKIVTKIYGFSNMGLFELSRQRYLEPLPVRINRFKERDL